MIHHVDHEVQGDPEAPARGREPQRAEVLEGAAHHRSSSTTHGRSDCASPPSAWRPASRARLAVCSLTSRNSSFGALVRWPHDAASGGSQSSHRRRPCPGRDSHRTNDTDLGPEHGDPSLTPTGPRGPVRLAIRERLARATRSEAHRTARVAPGDDRERSTRPSLAGRSPDPPHTSDAEPTAHQSMFGVSPPQPAVASNKQHLCYGIAGTWRSLKATPMAPYAAPGSRTGVLPRPEYALRPGRVSSLLRIATVLALAHAVSCDATPTAARVPATCITEADPRLLPSDDLYPVTISCPATDSLGNTVIDVTLAASSDPGFHSVEALVARKLSVAAGGKSKFQVVEPQAFVETRTLSRMDAIFLDVSDEGGSTWPDFEPYAFEEDPRCLAPIWYAMSEEGIVRLCEPEESIGGDARVRCIKSALASAVAIRRGKRTNLMRSVYDGIADLTRARGQRSVRAVFLTQGADVCREVSLPNRCAGAMTAAELSEATSATWPGHVDLVFGLDAHLWRPDVWSLATDLRQVTCKLGGSVFPIGDRFATADHASLGDPLGVSPAHYLPFVSIIDPALLSVRLRLPAEAAAGVAERGELWLRFDKYLPEILRSGESSPVRVWGFALPGLGPGISLDVE